MLRSIIPFILILAAVGLFFGYIDPAYQDLKGVRAEARAYDEALTKSKELQAIRDRLLSKYNTFSSSDIARLEKLLPDSVDNVRLVLDIDNIAARYGMRIRNVVLDDKGAKGESDTIGGDTNSLRSVVLSFSVSTKYEDLLRFLADLERSLRVLDVTALSFVARDGALNDYSISVKTYWLK